MICSRARKVTTLEIRLDLCFVLSQKYPTLLNNCVQNPLEHKAMFTHKNTLNAYIMNQTLIWRLPFYSDYLSENIIYHYCRDKTKKTYHCHVFPLRHCPWQVASFLFQEYQRESFTTALTKELYSNRKSNTEASVSLVCQGHVVATKKDTNCIALQK